MKIKEIYYKNFGRCVEISNETVRIVVTIDIGPRIINYSFIDGENILWEDLERKVSDTRIAETFGSPWYIYGGHRLWTGPEAFPRTYYADNNPVNYEVKGNSVRFIQEIQDKNGYQCEFTITLSDVGTDVKIVHKVINCSMWDIKLAPWAITVLSQGGIEIIPQPTVDTGLLGNRLIALWPYTKLGDKRVLWGEKYIVLRQDTSVDEVFKFGINSEHGFAMYFNHGDVFVKKFDIKKDGEYPDGGMSFETYICGDFLEMESLGELKTIAPGDCAEHYEYWSIFKGEMPVVFDDKIIDEFKEKYI